MRERVEELLHGSVLAVATVQGDESDLGPAVLELVDEIRADVDRDGLVPQPLERVLHARA